MTAFLPPSPLNDSQRQQLQLLMRELNPEQLQWLQGYLAGYRDAQAAPGAPVAAGIATAAPLTILFGSQTGNAEALARTLAERAGGRGLAVECLDMNDFPGRKLKDIQRLAIITSTHGEGHPPDNAVALHEFLYSRKAPKVPQLQYAVLSLGDSSYEHFCKTGADFDQRLAELGAERLVERVDCDLDYEDLAEQWMARVLELLGEPVAAPGAALIGSAPPAPTAPKYDRKRPFAAPLLERVCLNGRGASKAVYHLEFSLEGSGLSYLPGDSLGIYAENDPALVSRLLEQTGLDGDQPVALKDATLPLAEALRHHLELTRLTPPAVQQWAELSAAKTLTGLAEDRRALMEWLYGRDVLDLLQDYPVPGIDAQTLVAHLRPLPPRLYSIASSQAAVDEEVHLTVAAVRYHQRDRDRTGVASSWLAGRLIDSESARVFIDTNKNFRLPQDPHAPIIMIGPGTGVAPFRAFMQEREAQGQSGRNWLFFGDRNFRTDFLYQSEWLGWRKQGLLSRLDVAFSRDGPAKLYVQHRMREQGRELWQWLQDGAHVYVCGDASAMAPDVHEALLDIVTSHSGRGREEAETYLRELTQSKRYQRDVY